MNRKKTFQKLHASFIFPLFIFQSMDQTDPGLKLCHNQPSNVTWENAIPIGNGRIGAMIYGNFSEKIIQFQGHSEACLFGFWYLTNNENLV